MNSYFHTLITIEALAADFSEIALKDIVRANVKQDSLISQIFHNEYHYDNNKITLSHQYIQDQKHICIQAISRSSLKSARRAFGRLIHTAQDFYAHSNYAMLIAKAAPNLDFHEPLIDCVNPEIMNSKDLRSHKVYFPIDHLSIVPFFAKRLKNYAPDDSHVRMNLDTPLRGKLFVLVYKLAVKRTNEELHSLISAIGSTDKTKFNEFLGKVRNK
jgi:hypothetical protein